MSFGGRSVRSSGGLHYFKIVNSVFGGKTLYQKPTKQFTILESPKDTMTTLNVMSNNKLKIGWFSFSCSEDSTIVFTELMNEHWQEWKKIFDFRHARVLQSKNVLDELDIAFIEGAIASEKQAEQLKEIRQKSKKLVAVGACAVQGMPASQRNFFNEKQKKEIEPLLARFAALPKVLKVSEVVQVDAEVPGCPMDPDDFLKVLSELTKELGS